MSLAEAVEQTSDLPHSIDRDGFWRNTLNIGPFDIEVAKAEGVYYYDKQGTAYLDATGGPHACNVGHRDPRMVAALKGQLDDFYFVHPYLAQPRRGDYANRLAERTPGDLNNLFMVCGGSEAVETAIKYALHYHCATGNPGKKKIVGNYGSYHGMTLATMAASGAPGYAAHYSGVMPSWPHVHQYSDVTRPPNVSRNAWGRACALEFEKLLEFENPNSVAAFIATPLGSGADYGTIAPHSYWAEIRRICDEHNILLIADEVVTGFGRTGKFFGVEHIGILPDMMTIGKGMSSCAAPSGGVILSERVAEPFHQGERLVHGFTFQGHPMTVAASHAVLDILDEDDLVARSARLGERFLAASDRLKKHPTVLDVRGAGLLIVLELIGDRETREYFPPEKEAEHLFQAIALKHGMIFYSTLYGPRRAGVNKRGLPLIVSPPLSISEAELDDLIDRLDAALGEWEARLGAA